MKKSLQDTLAAIGTRSPWAPPKSDDPRDKLLHDLFIAGTAKGYFASASKAAKEAVLKHVDNRTVKRVVNATIRHRQGQTHEMLSTTNYTLVLDTRNPSESINFEEFEMQLLARGVAARTINECKNAATYMTKPAEAYKAIAKED